jgi:hypothetical protein
MQGQQGYDYNAAYGASVSTVSANRLLFLFALNKLTSVV